MSIAKTPITFALSLVLGLACITAGSSCTTLHTHAEASQGVWISIYRIQGIDKIEASPGGEAQWTYEMGVSDGENVKSQRDQCPPSIDDVVVNKTYSFSIEPLTYTTIYISLWKSDLNGTVIEVADISSDPDLLFFTCRYDFTISGIDSYTSDQYMVDGDYCKTSGDYDGNAGTDEKDANLWFQIWDNPPPVYNPTDLNKDGAVNILDIMIVAKAFGARLGDENWNEMADLDKNNIINIVDLFRVAVDFGRTV